MIFFKVRIYEIYWNDTVCNLDNPTMANCEQKVQESSSCSAPQGWMSQLIFLLPKEVGSKVSEGWMCQQGEGQSAKSKCSLLLCFLYKLPAEGIVHIKGISFHLKIWFKSPCLPALRSRSKVCVLLPPRSGLEVKWIHSLQTKKKISHRCSLHFCIIVHYRYSQVDNEG